VKAFLALDRARPAGESIVTVWLALGVRPLTTICPATYPALSSTIFVLGSVWAAWAGGKASAVPATSVDISTSPARPFDLFIVFPF
jgi:hypothetical protein